MKPLHGASCKRSESRIQTKRAALKVAKAIEKKSTKKKKTKNSSYCPHQKTAKANIRSARNKLPASRASKPSSSTWRSDANLFWIKIYNVHEKVAYEDIVRAIFQNCVQLRSWKATPSNLGGHFQDTIKVAFATKEHATYAVNQFRKQIKLFQQDWRIVHYKPKKSSGAAFSSSSDIQKAAESSDGGLTKLKHTSQDVDDGGKVVIFCIDERVPMKAVARLFEIAGRVRRHTVYNLPSDTFQGIVVVEYERRKDAVAAVKLFSDNINFFGKIWIISHCYDDDADADDGVDYDDEGGDVDHDEDNNSNDEGGDDDDDNSGSNDNHVEDQNDVEDDASPESRRVTQIHVRNTAADGLENGNGR